jgi:hypothetical protein
MATTLPEKNTVAPHSAKPPAMAPPTLCEAFQQPSQRPRLDRGVHLVTVE